MNINGTAALAGRATVVPPRASKEKQLRRLEKRAEKQRKDSAEMVKGVEDSKRLTKEDYAVRINATD